MAADCKETCIFYTHCAEVATTKSVPDSEQTPFSGDLGWGVSNGDTRVYAAKMAVHEMVECLAELPNTISQCSARIIAAQALTEVAMGFDRYKQQ